MVFPFHFRGGQSFKLHYPASRLRQDGDGIEAVDLVVVGRVACQFSLKRRQAILVFEHRGILKCKRVVLKAERCTKSAALDQH